MTDSTTDQDKLKNSFNYKGSVYGSLTEISAVSGIPVATLKSRMHRAKDNHIEDYDLGVRQKGALRTSSLLPHPIDPAVNNLTGRDFAALTSISQTTVNSRAKKYKSMTAPGEQTREGLLEYLLNGNDRSTSIKLTLPNGVDVELSINQLAKFIESDESLGGYKTKILKFAALKKRLQNLFKENSTPTREQILGSVCIKDSDHL